MLGGLITLTSYVVSPAVVKVPHTEWAERVLVWISINMPTGSTKSALYQYMHSILVRVRATCGLTARDPAWLLGDATCEKMGDLMAANGGRLLGLYDELSTFLTQLNLYKGPSPMSWLLSSNFTMAIPGPVLQVQANIYAHMMCLNL